jgi:hypothetical protein
MNNQFGYLVVKAHIDDLIRAAQRSRMARGAVSRSGIRARRASMQRPLGNLRRWSARWV